jgi:hypothetical protein
MRRWLIVTSKLIWMFRHHTTMKHQWIHLLVRSHLPKTGQQHSNSGLWGLFLFQWRKTIWDIQPSPQIARSHVSWQEQKWCYLQWKPRNDSWNSKLTSMIDSVQEMSSTNAQDPGKHCIEENSEENTEHQTIARCVSWILLHSSEW